MSHLKLEFSSQLRDQLVKQKTSSLIPIMENLEVRAKGYDNFFGAKAMPFACDDFFSYFMLARLNNAPFLTVKFTPMDSYLFYNQDTPIDKLFCEKDSVLIKKEFNKFKKMGWAGGFTYTLPPSHTRESIRDLAMDLTAFYLCYCFQELSPKGLLLTANIKSKIDIFLVQCGFKNLEYPHIIHRELNLNPAKLMVLTKPSDYMLECYQKYKNHHEIRKVAA